MPLPRKSAVGHDKASYKVWFTNKKTVLLLNLLLSSQLTNFNNSKIL